MVATSDDVPGLVTEAETPDELQRKLLVMIQELLEINDDLIHDFARSPRVHRVTAIDQGPVEGLNERLRQALEEGQVCSIGSDVTSRSTVSKVTRSDAMF